MKYFTSYENKHHVEIVSEYVNKTLTIFSHFPTKIREKTEEDKYCQKWIIEMDDYCSQYTTTLEQAHNAANDFLAGYEYAKREVMPSLMGETIVKRKRKGE